MAFDVYGTKGALRWNLETMNEMEVFLVDEEGRAPRGYTKVYAGDRYPFHGHFVPGRRQLDRLRGPEGDRELQVPHRGRVPACSTSPASPRRSTTSASRTPGCVRASRASWTDVVSLRAD